jgi:uncharacterized protein
VTLSKDYDAALREAQRKGGDLKKAYKLLTSAYKAGDERATYALGTWYLYGREDLIEKDLTRAVAMLREAAEANCSDALHDLAVCYAKGVGVKRSDYKAAELYLQAALHGDKQSAFEMGRCYWHGIGVQRNRRIARVWLDYAELFEIRK